MRHQRLLFVDLGFAAMHGEEEPFSLTLFLESGCCHLLSANANWGNHLSIRTHKGWSLRESFKWMQLVCSPYGLQRTMDPWQSEQEIANCLSQAQKQHSSNSTGKRTRNRILKSLSLTILSEAQFSFSILQEPVNPSDYGNPGTLPAPWAELSSLSHLPVE